MSGSLKQAKTNLFLASSKLELLRMSLRRRLEELPSDTTLNKMEILRQELDATSLDGTVTRNYHVQSTLTKAAPLTGKLTVRWESLFIGSVDLLARDKYIRL